MSETISYAPTTGSSFTVGSCQRKSVIICGPIKVRSYSLEKSGNKLDYFGEESSSVSHESLLATVILYVSNITEGGELLFPDSEVKLKRSWSDCSERGNILRSVKRIAVLFFTRHLNATLDQTSTHIRCPVLNGELLVATKLIYAKKQARKDDEEESGESIALKFFNNPKLRDFHWIT
nr:PREDICTED: probable prolyl 4-hydroxylase 12 [Raphanus sativus]